MASGGYRPGSGRPVGALDSKPRTVKKGKRRAKKPEPPPEMTESDKIRQLLSVGQQAKKKILTELLWRESGKPNNAGTVGKPLSLAERRMMAQIGAELAAEMGPEEAKNAAAENLDPLTYGLRVMNDPNESKDRRDRMAIALLPYTTARVGEKQGKKDEKNEAARRAGQGKFQAGRPPLAVVK